MKSIRVRITGTTPLMVNSPKTVNPLNSYTKKLKELTSKRQKTDDDNVELFRIHFIASLYQDNEGRYILPCSMLKASAVAAAKENKLGAKFKRSVMILNDALLQFPDNTCTPAELWENHAEEYVDIRPVGVMNSKIMATRAIFPKWSAEYEVLFDETQINDGEIWNALNIAGLRYGVGTYRELYGRFSVEEIKDKKKKK